MIPQRVLLVASTTGYQIRVFEETARRIGLDVVLATDRCHQLDDPWADRALWVRFEKPGEAATFLAGLQDKPDAIVAVGDRPTEIAALTAAALKLPFHPPEAVRACRDKHASRECFRRAGLPVPEYFLVPSNMPVANAARWVQYPCVLKPLGLSGSRGVIRANVDAEFRTALTRIRALLDAPDIRRMQDVQSEFVQVESYIPGREFAVEGLVTQGQLTPLAIFDKPDPLDGPFFEETIYVTPSRAPETVQRALIDATQRGAHVLGLTDGPIHAEMRHNDSGVWLLEIAARPIGGLCAGALRFDGGMGLEELVLRHALGEDVRGIRRENVASGVMMIPIPSSGIYGGVTGIEDASATPHVCDVNITAKEGQRLLQLPEGASYLGFIFARAETPAEVEQALREAHKRLRFEISAELPVIPSA